MQGLGLATCRVWENRVHHEEVTDEDECFGLVSFYTFNIATHSYHSLLFISILTAAVLPVQWQYRWPKSYLRSVYRNVKSESNCQNCFYPSASMKDKLRTIF
jgi:hypothetical protein